uniref:uncharacterized protein LOC129131990 n=1 Tax=Agelaius phoeniceus TaxID=39638 RepID=UPI0023EDE593|nr:uncharacterized protein LOC129131990 [Agelaius phoeniceus]
MEAIAKVVSLIHMQWGIKCELRNFNLALTRLLEIGVISRPIDILHSEVWQKCTVALAEDTKATGSSKSLKAWGKAEAALRKALEEQETWNAARSCLLIAPQLGEGAIMRTPPGGDPIESGETGGPGATHPSSSPKPPEPSEPPGDPLTPSGDPPGPRPPPEPPGVPADPSPNPSPPLADLAQEAEGLARSFWEGLATEARNIERAGARAGGGGDPPPYPFEYGAGGREEGWSPPVRGRTNPEPRPAANTHARETSAEPMPGRDPQYRTSASDTMAELCSTTNRTLTPPIINASATGPAGDAPNRDPWVALAMKIGKEPLRPSLKDSRAQCWTSKTVSSRYPYIQTTENALPFPSRFQTVIGLTSVSNGGYFHRA